MPNLEQRPRVGKSKLTAAGVGASLAQAAKALDQHWGCQEGILAVDQVIEQLVIGRRGHIEELLDCALFGTCIAPPLAFEVENADFELCQSLTL